MVRCFSFTSAEREVNYSRHSGMSQSCFLGDKTGHTKSVGFRFYSAISRSESRISSIYLDITSIYSSTYSRKKELLFCLARCFEPTHLCNPAVRSEETLKLWDQSIVPLRPKVIWLMKNGYEIMHQFRDKTRHTSSGLFDLLLRRNAK